MKKIEEFNDETRLRINGYINEINELLPNLFTKDELLNLILEGLNENIEFNVKLPERVQGQYQAKDLKVSISDNIVNEKVMDKVLFHEFTHVITKNIYKNDIIRKKPYISEILTTMLEKKYIESKIGRKTDRINGYISNFGDQLETIYGDTILKQFLKDPENISNVFYSFSDSMKTGLLNLMASKLQTIKNEMEQCGDDKMLKLFCRDLEKIFFVQSEIKIHKEGLTDENLEMLDILYKQQYYPESYMYISLINKFNNPNIDKYPTLKLLDIIKNSDNINELLELVLIEKKKKKGTIAEGKTNYYLAKKIFGFPNSTFDVENEKIDIFLSEELDFFENEKLYLNLTDLLVHKVINLEEIGKMAYRMQKSNDNSFKNVLQNGNSSDKTVRLLDTILGRGKLPQVNALYNNDELKIIIDENKSVFRQLNTSEILEQSNEYNKNSIKKVVKLLEERNINNAYVNMYDFEYLDEEKEFNIFMYRHDNDDVFRLEIGYTENENNFTEEKIALNDEKKLISSFSDTKSYHK